MKYYLITSEEVECKDWATVFCVGALRKMEAERENRNPQMLAIIANDGYTTYINDNFATSLYDRVISECHSPWICGDLEKCYVVNKDPWHYTVWTLAEVEADSLEALGKGDCELLRVIDETFSSDDLYSSEGEGR